MVERARLTLALVENGTNVISPAVVVPALRLTQAAGIPVEKLAPLDALAGLS